MNRLETLTARVQSIEGVEITSPFVDEGGVISGSVDVSFADTSVSFDLRVLPAYPMQFHNTETIRFINKNLLKYNHVNSDGSVCINTLHSSNLTEKLLFDFSSLKEWIRIYYIEGRVDNHYEHIIVSQSEKSVFLFTSVDYRFRKDEYGFISYSHLSIGVKGEQKVETFVIQHFKIEELNYECGWSSYYKILKKKQGLFVFIENAPTRDTRFAVDNWSDLEPYVNQEFLKFLHMTSRQRHHDPHIPLLIGYRIPDNEIHWQCVLIPTRNFPNYAEKIAGTTNYQGRFADQKIDWVQTRNCSYNYFFGRGSFPLQMTDSKILIIGLGAIGSNVATTLARGGCRSVALIDYDLKEPENVCRAEYLFSTGVGSKIHELALHLMQISPFIEVSTSDSFMDLTKITLTNHVWRDILFQKLSEYDIIFDCSTDNDVAFILDQLEQPSKIFTLSVTNKASQLICAVPPKLYKWMNDISYLLRKEEDGLYNPTGCWSPTFKASYNDIIVLVQFAIKHISLAIAGSSALRSFYLEAHSENGFGIKLKEF